MYKLYTIGHSNHTQEKFLDLLTKAHIDFIVDVRSNPNSRWATFANRGELEKVLESSGIDYLYLGNELGGHPSDPDCYDAQTGGVNYLAIGEKEYFKRGIKRILDHLKGHNVCIMCAEEDPSNCHRHSLIGASLSQKGITILHVRGDGRIQTDEDLWKDTVGVSNNQIRLL